MSGRQKDPIAPIPSRSAFPVHGDGPAERDRYAPVPTRGPLQTTNDTEDGGPSGPGLSVRLNDVVERMRATLNNLPLTIIVHGWRIERVGDFLDLLRMCLTSDDAIWLVDFDQPSDDELGEGPGMEGAVLLSLNQPLDPLIDSNLDRQIYSNLVGDIVFFPAVDKIETESAQRFAGRAHLIIVDGVGPEYGAMVAAGASAGLGMCAWSREGLIVGCRQFDGDSAVSAEGDEGPDIDQIGEVLKDSINTLGESYGRRLSFRSEIQKLVYEYPAWPGWKEHLILQAHKHRWPEWAVHCLPGFFVPLRKQPSDERTIALVWRLIVSCVPDRFEQIIEELCGGQILKVVITAETADFLEPIARIFEKDLGSFVYPTERSFVDGAIYDALGNVQRYLEKLDPAASQRIRQMSESMTRLSPLPRGSVDDQID